ncbi:hypothetical protein BH23ACT1_BH23ACT1_08950 [soil metagenome]
MRSPDDIDELQGDATLRAFADDIRAYASGPAPTVRADLASVLAVGIGGGAPAHDPAAARSGPLLGASGRLRDRLQGRRGRVALGLSVLSLTMLGTGGAGALPAPAQAVFERTAEVMGIELPHESRPDEVAPRGEPATEPGGPVGPVDGDERVPGDGRSPDRPPVDVPDDPAVSDSPGAGDRRPGGPNGTGAPGGDVDREGRDRLPGGAPQPVSPPGGVPDDVPAGPPDGGRGDRRGGGAEGENEEQAEEDEGQGRAPALRQDLSPRAEPQEEKTSRSVPL